MESINQINDLEKRFITGLHVIIAAADSTTLKLKLYKKYRLTREELDTMLLDFKIPNTISETENILFVKQMNVIDISEVITITNGKINVHGFMDNNLLDIITNEELFQQKTLTEEKLNENRRYTILLKDGWNIRNDEVINHVIPRI
jgi:hypothetical protein